MEKLAHVIHVKVVQVVIHVRIVKLKELYYD